MEEVAQVCMVKNGLTFTTIHPPNKFKESAWITIKTCQNATRLYACVYRSPNATQQQNETLLQNLRWAHSNFKEVVILGDFNLPSLDWSSETATRQYESEFLDCISECSYEQLVEHPTRHRIGQQSSLLDLILTNEPDAIRDIKHEAPMGKSDHEVLSFIILNSHVLKQTKKQRFNLKRMDDILFREPVMTVDWKGNARLNGVMNAYSNFSETVNRAFEASTPKYTIQELRRAPWSCKAIEKAAKKKRKCWDRFKYTNFDETSPECERYKQALQDFNSAKERAVIRYENKIIKDKPSNQRKFYAYMSNKSKYRETTLLLQDRRGSETSDAQKCAEILNDTYSRIFTKGSSTRAPEIKTPRILEDMPDVTFTTEKVKTKLEALDTKKSTGPDGIPALLLKKHAEMFAPILCMFFQELYEQGLVPSELKQANITPIFKSGNKKDPSNYRPVSITPIVAKIFESIIYDDLLKHIEDHNVVSKTVFKEASQPLPTYLSFGTE